MTAKTLPGIENLPHAEGVDLTTLTSMATPGTARCVVTPPDAEALGRLLRSLAEAHEPFTLLGDGTNVIFTRTEVRSLIIRLGAGLAFIEPTEAPERLRVGAATPLAHVLNHALRHELAGFEWAVGIPGTIGGAVVGNAGTAGRGMGDLVVALEGFTRAGDPVALGRDDLRFEYRDSNVRHLVVTVVELALTPSERDAIRGRMEEARALRQRQPHGDRSSGCIFRNPPGDSAGRLIDEMGLKNTAVGQARVSPDHANFLVNDGDASPEDILGLIDLIRRRVADETGVHLQTEVILLDPDEESAS